jgi:putative chitinase
MSENPVWLAAQAVAPHLKIATLDVWVAALEPPMASSGITTPQRIAAFMGQIAVESGGFVDVVENLNYSAARMCEVWPSHFASVAAAQPYAYQPAKLANFVYADRNGNGDTASGDGWAFRGRGLIQLTGRANYTAFAAAMKHDIGDTDWAASPAGAADAACWFWSTHSLNRLADGWQVSAITRAINGGAIGVQARISLSNAALRALQSVAPAPVVPAPAPETADQLMAAEQAADGETT